MPLNNANRESDGFLLTRQHLWTGGKGAVPPPPRCAPAGELPLTHVTLDWHEGREEDWLRFGRPVAERIVDRHRRIESYAPGQRFALVRWASNDYGTRRSSLDVVRAVGTGEPYTTMPKVDPGGEILLSVKGWPRVRQVFAAIDAVEQAGFDPCAVAPDYWRHVHNRIAARMAPRRYTPVRHAAWLLRRDVSS